MPELLVERLAKRLGTVQALDGASLTLERGAIIALLGPSGSGKTTLLRCVAGLERPDAGRVLLRDQVIFDAERRIETPAEQRGLGLVFQSYALWPHRTVFDNVAYGLRLRKVPAPEMRDRVAAVLAQLGLGDLGGRYPDQLSGGQQQRVALARALVYNPQILLLDEPLSNLDAKLRDEARAWLRELILRLQLSALYVTHDQVEAASVADRIILLQAGRIDQEGPPEEIYGNPTTRFAAEFMGSNNLLDGNVAEVQAERALLVGDGWQLWGSLRGPKQAGEAATGVLRVERLRLADGPGDNVLRLQLTTVLYLGERWEYVFALGDLRLRAWGPAALLPGERWVHFPAEATWIF
jgi:iron(III) transport system ATP-binding protein